MNLRKSKYINDITQSYYKKLDILVEELKKKYDNLDNTEFLVIQTGAEGKRYGLTDDYYKKSNNWRIVVDIPYDILQYIIIPEYITSFYEHYNTKLVKHNNGYNYYES